jgi:hypothetical protein
MISDVLFDADNKITQYRKDFPDYDADPAIARWLDIIVQELATLGDIIGRPPPPDNRTQRGECRHCHEIATINLGTLACDPCQAKLRAQLEVLAELAPADEELEAQFDADHAEWLNETTMRIVGHLRRLDKANRDHILAAISKQLLEAR